MVEVSALNSNQRKAVEWDDGPLLVLAGPGAGKTRVLACRIARIIEETSGAYFRVVGLTCTDKAAAEMRERIAALTPNAARRTLVTTFHSFCADLLRQHGSHIGLRPDLTIFAQDGDRYAFLEEAIRTAGVARVEQTSEMLLPLITRLCEGDVDPEDAHRFLERRSFAKPKALATVYRRYRTLMIERNALDFAALIPEASGLLKKHAGLRKHVRNDYPYVCVDEVQNSNLSQYRMLQQLISPTATDFFVVADDAQIMRQCNGTNLERIWDLQRDFGMKMLQLFDNVRCPPMVVELANTLIARNPGFVDRTCALTAFKEAGDSPEVRLRSFDDFREEAAGIAANIAVRTPEARARRAVLAPTKKLLVQVVEALNESGVGGYLAERKNEFESASLQWLHSVLRLANARTSREHLRRVCEAFYTLEGIDLNVGDIVSHASVEESGLLRSWAVAALARPELSRDGRALIAGTLVPSLVDRMEFWRFQDHAFRWFDALPAAVPRAEAVCERDDGYEGDERYEEYEAEKEDWHRLVADIASQYGRKDLSLRLLLQELDLRSKAPPPPKGAVPCFTIRASKGMEFDHVYLVGLVEGQLPSWSAVREGDSSREMQEERRNCFVAITRTQETLTLSYADQVGRWRKEPSRFLYEMGLLKRQ